MDQHELEGRKAARAGKPRERGWDAFRSTANNEGYKKGYDKESLQMTREAQRQKAKKK